MKIDFNYEFKNMDGEVIPERPDETEEVDGKKKIKKSPAFTLRKACVRVLLDISGDQIVCPQCGYQIRRAEEMSGEKKIERYEFAKILHNSNGLVDIRPEEQVLLKKLIGKNYPPLTVGQAWEILDPHEAGETKKKS